jgi:hypothetical protein
VDGFVAAGRRQPDQPQGGVADRVQRRDRPAEHHVERADRAGDPQGGAVGLLQGDPNAVYHATGIRVRDLPITLDKLLQ